MERKKLMYPAKNTAVCNTQTCESGNRFTKANS